MCILVFSSCIKHSYRGQEFRKDYGHLGMLCAAFSQVPVVALTATANFDDVAAIKCSLGLKNCHVLIGNPDRPNIYYQKCFREGSDYESIEKILLPVANDLLKCLVEYPITIIYLPLKWCGFAYKLFEHVLGNKQYYPPGSPVVAGNRLFAQFHAPQSKTMKEEVLKQLTSQKSTVRVVFATVAFGMGVDVKSIRQIIHIGPPHSVREYLQETGRAGRDGVPSTAILYYNNRDIAKNKTGYHAEICKYCKSDNRCLRAMLLECLDVKQPKSLHPGHVCCSFCKQSCPCYVCLDLNAKLNLI